MNYTEKRVINGIPLTTVQLDCLEHQGICQGCPNVLESMQCQVRYTEGVAHKLGIEVRRRRAGDDRKIDRDKAVEMYRNGYSIAAIARFFGSATSTVDKHIRAAGVRGDQEIAG